MELKELTFLETKIDHLIKLVEFFDSENKKLRQKLRTASNSASFDQAPVEQAVKRIKAIVKQLKEEIK
jgi:uncharacterized protein (TIGR02449 family)